MIRALADENFNNDVLRGLRRRRPDVDVVRVQDVGLSGADDPAVLAWAAAEGRVLLTHDVTTVISHALARLDAGLPMAGVFAVSASAARGAVIADLVLVDECSTPEEWAGLIVFLPLR
jgi:hypothetical protein